MFWQHFIKKLEENSYCYRFNRFLYRITGFEEPLNLIGIQMGREGVEDALMVVVEPLDFLLGHHFDEDGSLVDRTEGERLKL